MIGSLRRFEQDAEFFNGLERSLKQEFANERVAFHHGEVVSHGATLDEVLHQMREKGIRPRGKSCRFLILTHL